MEATVDLEEHFVEVPLVEWTRRLASQAVGIGLAESKAPFSYGFIAHLDAAHG